MLPFLHIFTQITVMNTQFQQYAAELVDSIKYAQDRGLEPCNDFHKFVCAGVHKQRFKEVLTTKRWSDVSHQAINQAVMIDHLAEIFDQQQQQQNNASPSINWMGAKCVHRQMLPFYTKCTAINTQNGDQIGSELKTTLDENAAKLFGGDDDDKRKLTDGAGVGFGDGHRNDRLLLKEAGIVAAFPFIPFFTIQRVAYGTGERMVLLPKESSLFLAPACSSSLSDQKMHAILRHLHQMGIFDNFANADEMDAVFAEFAAINRHLAIKFAKTTSSSMQFPIRIFQLFYTPSIDWTHILNKLLEKYGGGGNNNEKRVPIQQASTIVLIKKPSFFSAVTKLMDEYTRTGSSKNGNNIRRRAIFEYMRLFPFWHLLGEIGDPQLNSLLASLGTRPLTKSPTNCIDHYLRKYFPHCLENALAHIRREEFNGDPAAAASSKTDKLQFFERFRQGFVDFLGTAGTSKWMPSAMRTGAIIKLRGLRANFGLDLSEKSEASSIDKFYEHFKTIGANTSWLKILLNSEEMSAFWPPSNMFGLKSTTVEYEPTTNSVFIGPAFWQKPWWWSKQKQPKDGGHVESRDDVNDDDNFDDDNDDGRGRQKTSTSANVSAFSSSMFSSRNILSPFNYGSAGHVIAHELAHSLDPNNVWRNDSGKIAIIRDAAMYLQKRKYNSQLRCLRRQYANYWIEKERKNSQKTLNEDFADNVGLHVAYIVFKADLMMMSRTNRQQNEQNNSKFIAAIAGELERFTEEQLFFIAFAYKQCRKYTKPGRRLSKELVDREHSFPSARINLPLINLTAFANAFKCPIGTRMNPVPMPMPKNDDEKEKNNSVVVGLKCPFA